MAKRRRSRAGLNWKTDIGGMPVWAIAAVSAIIVAIVGVVAVAPVIRGDANAEPYVRPSDAFDYSTPAPDAIVVAFLGDSYTVGARATEPERWTTIVSRELGWQEHNFGIADTGYSVVGSMEGGNLYRDRIADIAALDPDIVIVSGGRNDLWGDTAVITESIDTTFAELRAAVPDAQIIAANPWWGDSEVPAQLNDIGAAVRQAAERVGGIYVDSGQPLSGHPEWMHEDAVHPIAPGYAAIAAAFLAGLPL